MLTAETGQRRANVTAAAELPGDVVDDDRLLADADRAELGAVALGADAMKARWPGVLRCCILAAAIVGACRANQAPPDDRSQLALLSGRAGLIWPSGAHVLAEDADARAAAEGAGLWIILTRAGVKLPGEKVNVPAASVRRVVQSQLPNLSLGESADVEAPSHEWTNGASRWRGAQLSTATGVYLVLERSKP